MILRCSPSFHLCAARTFQSFLSCTPHPTLSLKRGEGIEFNLQEKYGAKGREAN